MIHNNGANYFSKRLVYFKGGGGGGNFDAAYNARMATIAESQQGMAQEYYNFWQTDYKPMEQAQIQANQRMLPVETDLNIQKVQAEGKLLPGQTALVGAQNESNLSLLPGQTALAGAQMQDTMTAIGEKAPVRSAFFKEALEGVSAEGRAAMAGADAAHAFAGSQAAMGRDAARMGINPNSGRFASMTNTNALNRAKMIAGARTGARTGAEQENFTRLQNAMGY